jgi:hypothetical protein
MRLRSHGPLPHSPSPAPTPLLTRSRHHRYELLTTGYSPSVSLSCIRDCAPKFREEFSNEVFDSLVIEIGFLVVLNEFQWAPPRVLSHSSHFIDQYIKFVPFWSSVRNRVKNHLLLWHYVDFLCFGIVRWLFVVILDRRCVVHHCARYSLVHVLSLFSW